ncbi:MAG: hypothetical protein OCD76_16510, partial [Reichenbachiella sp.]
MGSPPATILKKRIITWISIFIVLVLAFFGVLKLGIHYSKEILFELVKRETNGYYQLSFDELDIDVWNRGIKLKNVSLKPDSTKDFQATGLNNLYDLELGGLHIDIESISSIYTGQQLVVENVRMIDPRVHIIRKDTRVVQSFSIQTGNLYKEISDYLKVLRIDILSIENAELSHSPSDFGLGSIDFFIKNLLIDSASRPNQKFYSESIELEVHNQTFILGDSIHQLSFDRFLLSTADSVLTFENLIIKPISVAHGIIHQSSDKTVYNITIPKLKLNGVDYFSAYRNNHLEIEDLSFIDSHIILEDQTHSRKNQSVKKNNSLLKHLFKIFDEVKVGKMRFINTNLDLKTNKDYNQNYQHVKSKRSDIVLYNFILDSSNYKFDYGKKYFDDLDLIIKDYSSYLPDSIHTINFDLLQLSSYDSLLIFKNFKISNNGKGSPSDMFLSVDLPLLSLKGLNYLDVLMHKKLLIREMQLQSPNIIFEKTSKKLEKKVFSPDSVYSILAPYFKVVGIQNLIVNQGLFSINKQLRLGQANLMVSNFNINNSSNSWYDVLDDVELKIQHMVINDEAFQLKADHLKLDRIASRLIIDDVSMDYLDQNTSASGTLTQLTIAGIDLDSISTGHYLAFDSIKLDKPKIQVEILKPSERKLRSNILGDKLIEVVNGQINGKMHNATVFSFNKINAELTLGEINEVHFGHVEQISFTLPQSAHQLNVRKFTLTESQDLTITDIELRSIRDTLLHKVELNGHIPTLTLHGINQKMLWQHHKLEGDSLSIHYPDLNLNLNDIKTALAPTDPLEVQFKKVIIEKAHLTFSNKGQSAFERIKIPELSLTLEGFQYPQKSVLSADHLIYADDVTLNVKDLEPILTNGDAFIIRQLNFNKKHALVLIDTLNFDQANSSTAALLPHIKIIGLDFHAFLNKQQLKLDSIQMSASHITLDHRVIKMDKQSTKNTIPESIDIKFFSSIATEIELKDSLNTTSYAIHEGGFEFHEFYSKGKIVWNQFLNHTQFASISGKNLAVPLPDSYQLHIDHYELKHPKNTLTLDHLNLTSAFTAAEYTSHLTYQKNWFEVSVDDITFSGLNFKKALKDREYYTEKILFEGLNALIYRDKSVPFQPLVVQELPQSILRKIDKWIYIDTLQVKGDITYQQKPEKKEEVGEISFNSLDASLFQITTVDSMVKEPMHFVSTGLLADNANFEISVLFDMKDPKDKFNFSGHIDEMQLGSLNNMLRPVANINIKDGYAERIDFNIAANNELATGDMNLRYNNLKIQILNPEANDLKGLNKGVKTFFANTFVVKSKNPSFVVLRSGKIFQTRDSSRAIFHYWAQSLLSGAVSSIGIHKSDKAEKKYGKEV